jgi:hypothetical protein
MTEKFAIEPNLRQLNVTLLYWHTKWSLAYNFQ